MIQYPLTFPVQARATHGTDSNWECGAGAADNLAEIKCAIPIEFGGPGGGYSPEDLFALALVNCFIATFKVIASASRLQYSVIRGKALLTVDRNDSGKPWMEACSFQFTLEGVTERDKSEQILNKTSSQCLIWNSVYTKKNFTFTFTVVESSQFNTDHK